MQDNWFELWFNSKYYHILYKNRDDSEAQRFLDALLEKFHFAAHSVVLDLACGKGRHSRYLATQALIVVGMDLSEENIKFAQSFSTDNLQFEQQDMRDPFGNARFDLIMNLFTSFGYFGDLSENLKVCKNIYSALKPEGMLILDYLNPKWLENNLQHTDLKELEGIRFEISKGIEANQIVKNIRVIDDQKVSDYQERVDLITANQFHELFKDAGLTCELVYGNYQLDSFDEETSPRMIFVVHK